MLDKYKVILWDFDGVILDSMSIRDLGFVKVLEREGYSQEIINKLLDYHRKNGGLSRYVKFRFLYETLLKQPVSEEEINRLAEAFSEIMLGLLISKKLLITDSVEFIKSNYKNYKFHIVSGSDGQELRKICQGLEIDRYFLTIDGSPTPKKELVANVMKQNNYVKSEVCLIGDSINDYEAAEVNGVSFMGYNNLRLMDKGYYLHKLT